MEKLLVQVHQDTSSSVSRVSVLSLDLLLRILDRLPKSGDRKSFRLACRSFARAEASHRRSLKILRREFLIPLLRRYPAVESLDLSSCLSFGDESLAEACGGSSGVEWKGAGGAGGGVPGAGGGGPVALRGVGDREVAGARGLREVRLDKCLEVTAMGLATVAVGARGWRGSGSGGAWRYLILGLSFCSRNLGISSCLTFLISRSQTNPSNQ